MVKDLKIDVIIPNTKGCYDNTHVIVQGFVKFQARIMTMEGAEAINVGIAGGIVFSPKVHGTPILICGFLSSAILQNFGDVEWALSRTTEEKIVVPE